MKLKHIFDLDHTLYPDPADKYERYARANQRALADMNVTMDFETVKRLGTQSFKERGDQLLVFVEDYGLDYAVLNKLYHGYAVEEFKDGITLKPSIRDYFNQIAKEDKVILTHATSDWAHSILQGLGMADNLYAEHVLAQDHPSINYIRKDDMLNGEQIFRTALEVLQARAEDTVMYEDVAANLIIPKKLGMKTVLVHWGAAPDRKADHVDVMVADVSGYKPR